MPNDEHNNFHYEWRQIVLAKLDSLERGQKALEDKFVNFTLTSVKHDDYHQDHAKLEENFSKLEDRIRKLEEIRLKGVGAFVILQIVAGVVMWLGSLLVKHLFN